MALEEISFPKSSNIQSVSYDAEEQTLYVEFQKAIYAYLNVPGDVAYGFSQALSAGNYLNSFVKTQFEFRKVE